MRAAIPILVVGVVLALLGEPGAGAISVAVLGGCWILYRRVQSRRRMAEVIAAERAFDGPGLRAAVDALLEDPDLWADTREQLRFERVLSFLMEDRFEDALAALDSLDPVKLPPRNRFALTVNRAWCDANLGRAQQALEAAQRCLDEARARFMDAEAVVLGTIGAAQLALGRAEEAIASLREARAKASHVKPLEAIHALYLGHALRELGRLDDARREYAAAVELGGTSIHARKASVCLAELADS